MKCTPFVTYVLRIHTDQNQIFVHLLMGKPKWELTIESSFAMLSQLIQLHKFINSTLQINPDQITSQIRHLFGTNRSIEEIFRRNSNPVKRRFIVKVNSLDWTRVKGGLINSWLPFNHKHPVMLPSNHHFTKFVIVIVIEHVTCVHDGIQLTLNTKPHSKNLLDCSRTASGWTSTKKLSHLR